MAPRPEYCRANAPSWMHKTPPSYTRPTPPKTSAGPTRDGLLAKLIAAGHPDPEKMVDSLLRNREKSLAIEKAKHTLQVTDAAPKPMETVSVEKIKGRTIPEQANRCKATKLDGKQCCFKMMGFTNFCSKHSVKKTLV